MNLKNIKYDDCYECSENKTITYYFTGPKSLLKDFGFHYDNAESAELSLEFPKEHIAPDYVSVEISPTAEGIGYEWNDITLCYEEIEKLIKMAQGTLDKSTTWIIAIANSAASGCVVYVTEGTESDVKNILAEKVSEDKENDLETFDMGTETADDVYRDGDILYAYATYEEYHIDYTACPLSKIERIDNGSKKGY